MNYRKLGRTNLFVSEIGLGCEHLEGKDYDLVKSVIDAAIEKGINIFDIFMPEPVVRTNIGKALEGRRNKVILQGHIGAGWKNGQYNRTRDLEESKLFFEDFMTRLQTDYVDIGMLHFIDEPKDFEDVFNSHIISYAEELKAKGVIKAIGVSSHNPIVAKKAVETGKVDVLMFSINPAYDLLPETNIDALFTPETFKNDQLTGIHPDRAELYATCERMGTAITVMKTLGAGTLLSAQQSPFGVALTAPQCAHYALTRPAVASVLLGAKTPEQVMEAVRYEDATSEEKDYSVILSSTPKYSAKGRCMYCNHCLPCPSEIDIALVNKYLDLASVGDGVPQSIAEHYKLLKNNADDCIACGNCELNCPFDVHIIERMAKAKEIFSK